MGAQAYGWEGEACPLVRVIEGFVAIVGRVRVEGTLAVAERAVEVLGGHTLARDATRPDGRRIALRKHADGSRHARA